MTTQREADLINAERRRAADYITGELQKLGVEVRIDHYSGDSSYPTEYTISYGDIREIGPTFEMALSAWITKLLQKRDER